ncbi:SDR family NAD(P)-dependent oxidoreductase [Pseudomonas citronellolis]|uniref:SDR family NAD(P)-dependent oxidoreductase n=1 Tax=Pseudomonas citronellolis TaxID=53408 RepID=UPI0021BFC58F|nr:SDR family NAD(P)-dependent oxidoreductase [Pseudomonas citronellolis]UXJ50187.1 SDR family oxidoreductase [Pseudomonas citronellolis]
MNQIMQAKILAGRVALVTGAGGGVGRGIALALAEAGAKVVIAARRGATGEETARLIRAEGGEALSLEVDVTVLASMREAVATALQRFGGLDILVHNATHGASGHPKQLEAFDDEDWDAQVAVDLAGAHHCALATFDALRASDGARAIFLCSAFGLHGAALNPAYAAIKGGIRGLTKALAREWGPFGITVNAISPSALTSATEEFFASNPALGEAYMAKFPLGRIGHERNDVGRAVAGLCGPGMGYVTGQIIQVDGGLYTAV